MAINRPDLAYASTDTSDGHFRGNVADKKPEYFLSANLKGVMPGSIVQVMVSGSATGKFYYSLEESKGAANDLCKSLHAFTPDTQWTPLEASTLFSVPDGQGLKDLSFRLKVEKGNFTGAYDIYNLNIIARIL